MWKKYSYFSKGHRKVKRKSNKKKKLNVQLHQVNSNNRKQKVLDKNLWN